MNNILGIAKVKKTKIVYTYKHGDNEYRIETPKTPLNQGVENGEVVSILLGVMPTEGGKPSENKRKDMYRIDDE